MRLQQGRGSGPWWLTQSTGLAVLALVLVVAGATAAFSRGSTAAVPSPSPTAGAAAAAAAPTAAPTATSEPNRASCDQIRGTAYLSAAEQAWYQQNCSATPTAVASSSAGASTAAAAPARAAPAPAPAAPQAAAVSYAGPYVPAGGSVAGDRMVISRLGIDGYVSASYVGPDGQMGDPSGPWDILWYDFSGFTGLGGAPGAGGNAVFAGHVDYHPHIEAIFWTLRQAQPGDIIDYYKADGTHLQYQVQWNIDAAPDADFTDYVAQTGQDIMTIITCDGVFNPETRHYDHRSVVRAIRIS